MIGPDQAPTRAAVLELKEERVVVSEAYDFLDEKRLLLAAELLRQLEMYERLLDQIKAQSRDASRNLAKAVERHGLQGISVYPATGMDSSQIAMQQRNFMGVTLVETELVLPVNEANVPVTASNPSLEADQCRNVFQEIVESSAVLAGISGNLHRLLKEYRLTERRARALENVILPEIEQVLDAMSTHLEEMDLEDTVRARSTQNVRRQA